VGSPLTLYHRPANRFLAGFIGSPSMNFIDGVVVESGANRALVDCGGQLQAARVDGGSLRAGQKVTLGIRPEHIDVQRRDAATGWPMRVSHVEHLGEHGYVYARRSDGDAPLIAKVADEGFDEGDAVTLRFPPEAVHVFREDGHALQRLATAQGQARAEQAVPS
jgi:multiple sugar transport system ATP-binding protein